MNLAKIIQRTASRDIVWRDNNGRNYRIQEIKDRHLLNILNFVRQGKGHLNYLSEYYAAKLYDEAIYRRLRVNFSKHDMIIQMRTNKEVRLRIIY